MLTIPQSFTVSGYTIKVETGEKVDKFLTRMNAFGCFNPASKCVRLATNPSDERLSTYVHEIVEAVNLIYDLRLRHPTIQTLGLGIYQAMVTGKGKAKF